jgi:hypothetical protein
LKGKTQQRKFFYRPISGVVNYPFSSHLLDVVKDEKEAKTLIDDIHEYTLFN